MTNPCGYFNDETREYVVTRPDTPLPWFNYLGQEDFFGLCSHTGGGYSFWKDARLRRLTRYRYNNLPLDLGGRYLYIKHGRTVWNPGWMPVKTPLDHYECRHGPGFTRITGVKNGIETGVLFFVPPGENLEIWQTAIRNRSKRAQSLQVFSFIEFCFYEALNDMTNLQRTYSIGEAEAEGGALYHKTEYRERRGHYTLFACTRKIDGFDTSRDAFMGLQNSWNEPAAVAAGQCRNSIAHGWNPAGAHQIDLSLRPEESATFSFLLAYIEQDDETKFEAPGVIDKTKGRALIKRYSSPAAVENAFSRMRESWERRLGVFQAECPDEHLRRMVNIWNPRQCMVTFNVARSASGYETGIGRGIGFRDTNQDLLGAVHMVPERARQRILDAAAVQFPDGSCYHQYQPLTKEGNTEIGSGFNDDPLWLILSACAYIKETGDASILKEKAGYAGRAGHKAPLLEHLETSIAFTRQNLGPRGLPLIGHADWNDCLNLNCFSSEPNESFQTAGDTADSQAESVMIAGLFLCAAREMESLYRWQGKEKDAGRMRSYHAEMLKAIETRAWDGEWYLRAYDASGQPIGSRARAEGKIFVESQAWCVLGGAGFDNGRARRALESVHKHLYTPHGVVLQQPAFSRYYPELGEISSYPPGFKENAGVFCHNNPWVQIAWCLLGEGERALEYYLSICPSAKEALIDTYRSEPFVYAQMIAGRDAAVPGEAKNSWLTGTAAWSWVAATQFILGLRPDYDGLRLDPCIPSQWDGFRAARRFRGADYDITVENPSSLCRGVKRLRVNGREISGNLLPPADGERAIKINAVLEE